MRIAVTRPEEDAGPLKARLEAMGHQVVMAPLMTIRPRAGVAIPDLPWQAVAVTSANGIRALPRSHGLDQFRILTVGPQSLKAAAASRIQGGGAWRRCERACRLHPHRTRSRGRADPLSFGG